MELRWSYGGVTVELRWESGFFASFPPTPAARPPAVPFPVSAAFSFYLYRRRRSQEVTSASLARKYSPRPQQSPDAVIVADGGLGIETADPHPFGGVDEKLVPEVKAHMHYALRFAATRARPEEQQVPFLEQAQVGAQRHRHTLPGLLAGVALQVDAVEEEHRLGKAGAVKPFGRVAAPQVGPADESPGRAIGRGLCQ